MKKIFLNTLKVLRWLFTRAVVFYVLIYVLTNAFVDFDQIKFGYKIRLLNKIIPKSYAVVLDLAKGKPLEDKKKLVPYIYFYERLVGFFPERSDGFSMLGFCYYKFGEPQNAISAYQQAIKLNGDVFWFYYNKGLIFYKNRQFKEALAAFEEIINLDYAYTVKFIGESKIIYRLVSADDPIFYQNITKRLNRRINDVYFLIGLMKYSLKEHQSLLEFADHPNSKIIQDADFWFYAGLSAQFLKEYEQSVNYLVRCINRTPDNAKAWDVLYQSARASKNKGLIRKVEEIYSLRPKQNDLTITNKRVELRLNDLRLQIF